MQNLLNSTEIATLFLDRGLNIKRYTVQARRLVNLIATDLGRPLGDLVSNLREDRLADRCREVLDTLVYQQGEVQTRDGDWYLMRIMPYRTAENVIDGLVLTFVDINPVKHAELELALAKERLAADLDSMTRLHELGLLFLRGGSLGTVLDEVLGLALAITGSQLGCIQLPQGPGGRLRVAVQRGLEPGAIAAWEGVETGRGMLGAILAGTERTQVEDLRASPLLPASPALETLAASGVAAFQSSPLVGHRGALLGRITTFARRPGRLEERTLTLLDLLARESAQILERAGAGERPAEGEAMGPATHP
jgi:hypothetical protein